MSHRVTSDCVVVDSKICRRDSNLVYASVCILPKRIVPRVEGLVVVAGWLGYVFILIFSSFLSNSFKFLEIDL